MHCGGRPAFMQCLRARLMRTQREFLMLEIVWRTPNRLVRARVSVDKTWRNHTVTGQAQTVYRTRAAMGSPEVEYELVVNRREPVCAA
jgi:hypothetical protein